jgi:TIR domain/Effector-associated domain 1
VTAPVRNICVFVSYSHESDEHVKNVLALATQLRSEGFEMLFDQWQIPPPSRWPLLIEKWFRRADAVVCVCTPTYRDRFDGMHPAGQGRGATYEGELLRNEGYDLKLHGDRFHVVHMENTEVAIPAALGGRGTHFYRWPNDRNELIDTLGAPSKRRKLVDACGNAFGEQVEVLDAWAGGYITVGTGTVLDFDARVRRVVDDVLRLDDPMVLKEALASLANRLDDDARNAVDEVAAGLELGTLPRSSRGRASTLGMPSAARPCVDPNHSGAHDREGDEGWQTRVIEELAQVFHDPAQAKLLATQAGVPLSRLHAFTSPIQFWSNLVAEANNGLLPGGIRPILDKAVKMYPANPIFGRRR